MRIPITQPKLRPITGVAALLGLTLMFAALPAAAQPQGQWTQQQRAACEPDAMRLCNQYGADVQRITACMAHYRRYLSAPCRRVFYSQRKRPPRAGR
jgi:hypothetical protein